MLKRLLATGLIAGVLTAAAPAQEKGQRTFATPEEAVTALEQGIAAGDRSGMAALFGAKAARLIKADTPDAEKTAEFRKAFAEQHSLKEVKNGRVLLVGKADWPFPVPLKEKGGKWYFDGLAGHQEVINRRIGQHELVTIEVLKAYVLAQREYFAEDHNGNGIQEYAQHLLSTPGTRDGLYWPPKKGTPKSPLGDLIGKASPKGSSYNGYKFKLLKQQGPAALGGAYNYVINGHQIAGYALLAYPAQWGETGVMTFVVNQQGRVYQKNLGPDTGKLAPAIESYNPDKSWALAEK